MSYTPPAWNEVNLVLSGAYVSPSWNSVNLVLGEGSGIIILSDGVTLSDSISVKITFNYSLTDGVILSDEFTKKIINFKEFFEANVKLSDSFFLGNFILSWIKRIKISNDEIVGYRIKVYRRSTGVLLRTEDQVVSDPNNFSGQFVYSRDMNEADNGSFIETDLSFLVYQLNDDGFYSPPTTVTI